MYILVVVDRSFYVIMRVLKFWVLQITNIPDEGLGAPASEQVIQERTGKNVLESLISLFGHCLEKRTVGHPKFIFRCCLILITDQVMQMEPYICHIFTELAHCRFFVKEI